MGLQIGGHTPSTRGSAATKRGGNCIIRAATRRRYSASQLLMLQNPHHSQPEVRRATSKTDAGPIGAKKLAQHRPSTGISVKKFALYATKRRFWAIFRTLGELFRAHAHHQIKQGELFRAQDPARGDFATNDTSAATDAGQHETTITTARP